MTEPRRLGDALPLIATRGEPSALRRTIALSGAPMYRIAGMVGIDPSVLSKYANKRRTISHEHMLALCDLFECEPEDLLD